MLGFFNAKPISVTILGQLITLVSWIIILVNIYLLKIPVKPKIANSLATPVNLMFAAIFISMIPAYLYHDQSIFSSLIAYKNFYVFFLYFILFKLQFSYKQILNLSILLFIITLIIFLIDYYTFPNSFFSGEDAFERRGAFTIRFDGQGFTVMGTFFCLAAFFRTSKFYYFILYVIGFCFLTFFTASRIQLLSLIINTLFVLRFYRKTIKKYFLYIIPVIVAAISVGIYYLKSYVLGLYLLAFEETRTFESNIRYEAMKFFTGKFQTNEITKILGNGYPNHTSGTYQDSFIAAQYYGFFTSDLGLIGFWTYFGILGVIAWLVIFKKILISKTDDNNIFIKAYFVDLLFTITLGYAIFNPGYMITTVFCFFLFDKNKQDNNKQA